MDELFGLGFSASTGEDGLAFPWLCKHDSEEYDERVKRASDFERWSAQLALRAISPSLEELQEIERELTDKIQRETDPARTAFLRELLPCVKFQLEACERRDAFFQNRPVMLMLGSVWMSADLDLFMELRPQIPYPFSGDNVPAPFTSAPNMYVKVEDWGPFAHEEADVREFLEFIDKGLPETLEFEVADMSPSANYRTFEKVFCSWTSLERLSVRVSAGGQATALDAGLESIIGTVDPQRLDLLGHAGLLTCNTLARLTRVHTCAFQACDASPTILGMLPNIRSLPPTVREVSLALPRYKDEDKIRDRKMLVELDFLLDALPDHVSCLELTGFQVWQSMKVVQKIFASNRFTEIRLFNAEETEFFEPKLTNWQISRINALSAVFQETQSLEKFKTDEVSFHTTLLLAESCVEVFEFTVPFFFGRFDCNRQRAYHSLKLSHAREAKYSGIMTLQPQTLDFVKEAETRGDECYQRYRCLLFNCLQLAPTAPDNPVPSLGAVPMHVLQGAAEFAKSLTIDKDLESYEAVLLCGRKFKFLAKLCFKVKFFEDDPEKHSLALTVCKMVNSARNEIDFEKALSFICNLMKEHNPDLFDQLDAQFNEIHREYFIKNIKHKRALDQVCDSERPDKQARRDEPAQK